MMKKPFFIFALVLVVVFAGCVNQNQQTKTTTTRLITTTNITSTTTTVPVVLTTTTTISPERNCTVIESFDYGACAMWLGWIFNGATCVGVSGCGCGDCIGLFETKEECEEVCSEQIITTTSTTTTTVDKYYCEQNSDCVAEKYCHPNSCINVAFREEYEPHTCTDDCRDGTIDCGAGKCVCRDNKCTVEWITVSFDQEEIPDDYSLGSINPTYKSCYSDYNCTSYCGYLFKRNGVEFGAGECVNTAYDFYSQPKLENAPLCEQDTKINCYSCSCIGGLCYSKKESEYC